MLARVKVTLVPERYAEDKRWNQLEVLDVQFINAHFSGWQPWLIKPYVAEMVARKEAEEFEAKKRRWTDNTGTFHVEAVLMSFDDSSVTLKKRDGSHVTVPLERLSEVDRKYVEEQRLLANIRVWDIPTPSGPLKATLLRVVRDKAILRLKDGKVVTIPVRLMSEADKKYVLEQLKAQRNRSNK